MLALVGVPAMQTTTTIGGSRFLLNLRAAYFSSMGNRTSTRTGYTRSTGYTETEGTVGVFRPVTSDRKDEGDDGEADEAGSIEMGVWANNDPQDDRPTSPPVIMLQPILPNNTERLAISASDLSEPAHSSTRLRPPPPKTSDLDVI
ncbi:hypothetical protein M407DRAFT_25883 [Tulasnella calospora MUT 4182]|uniref:Uncharacterized protein n=1 Tax=Tulasnella calospora MUT 4182 TaxID=1051891 RepID=A0A0C3Q657_9AGAM|nr:hypothetical protein M407DRAFT_25883 [Tulasnella calospora MUT 4182]